MYRSLLAALLLVACTPSAGPVTTSSAATSPASTSVAPGPQASASTAVKLEELTQTQPSPTAPPVLLLPSEAPVAQVPPSRLRLNKESFSPAQEIEVRFELFPDDTVDATAWAGIVPAEVPHGNEAENDIFDLAYAELANHRKGTLVFQAPEQGGNYEVRLFSSDNGGRELASVAFKVNAPELPLSGNMLRLTKSFYQPGETIHLQASINAADKADESAWVGLVPAEVEHGSEAKNDAAALAYQFMGPYLAGKMRFEAPQQPGIYDLRLHSSDKPEVGVELAFVTLIVK